MANFDKRITKVICTEEQLKQNAKNAAAYIEKRYAKTKQPIVLIGILKGCIPFFAEVLRNIKSIDVVIDFMAVSSYYNKFKSSGLPKINMDINEDITDRDVVIIEDIVDTALTLTMLIDYLKLKGPKSIACVTCVDKVEGRKVPYKPDFGGIKIPNHFVVGYGLDLAGKMRNLPYIGILDKKYQK